MIDQAITELVQYGLDTGLVAPEDKIFVTNQILEALGLESYEETPGSRGAEELEQILKEITDYAVEKELIAEEEQEDMLEELIDRFGDPPRKVQQLLMIAQLKAKAHAAYVISVEQKGDEYKFTMYEKARVNVAKIPELLAKYKGELTFKTDAENPYFIYCKLRKNKKEKAEQILENAGKIVEDIQGLVEE